MSIIYGTLERLEADHALPGAGTGKAVSPRQVDEPSGLLGNTLVVAVIVILAGTSLMLWRQLEDPIGPIAVTSSAVVDETAAVERLDAVSLPAAGTPSANTGIAPPAADGQVPAGKSTEPAQPASSEAVVAMDPQPVVEKQAAAPTAIEASAVAEPAVAAVVADPAVKVPPVTTLQVKAAPDQRQPIDMPAHVDDVIDRARSALSRGQYEQALSALETLQPVPEGRADFWLVTGSAHLGLGQLDQAERAFDAARELTPGNAHIAVQMAIVMQERGDHAGALEILNAAAGRHPDVPEIYLNLGYSQLAVGGHLEARRSFRAFLAMTEGRSLYQQQRSAVQEWLLQFPSIQ